MHPPLLVAFLVELCEVPCFCLEKVVLVVVAERHHHFGASLKQTMSAKLIHYFWTDIKGISMIQHILYGLNR